MPDHSERHVTIYDLTIAPARARDAPPTRCEPADFVKLRDAVKSAAAAKTPMCDDADERGRKLFLMDMEVHNRRRHVVFVWTLSDPGAAAQMYLSREAMVLRAAEKDDDEDVALSSHMVIDLDVPPGWMRYPTALEDHEGIARLRTQKLFQTVLQTYMPPVTAVLEDGLVKVGAPKVILAAHPGRLIGDSGLKPVQIDTFKLTPRRALVADDADYFYQAIDRQVFKRTRDGPVAELRDRALAKVRELRGVQPDHRIRIRWRDEADSEAADEITELDPLDRPERLLERALTRTVLLSGFRHLPDATNIIIARLAERMLQTLRDITAEDAKKRR